MKTKRNYILIGGFVVAGLVIGGIIVYEVYKAKKRKKEEEEIEKELAEWDDFEVFEDDPEEYEERPLTKEDQEIVLHNIRCNIEGPARRNPDGNYYTDDYISEDEVKALFSSENDEDEHPLISDGLEKELAENEHPLDDGEDVHEYSEEELEALEEDYENNEFYLKNRNRPPRIISENAVKDLPNSFDTEEWIYWAKDDVMTNEEEEPIEDFMRFVGDELDRFEWRDNDESEAWVVSYEFMTVYHVVKYMRSYSEEKSAQYAADYENAGS